MLPVIHTQGPVQERMLTVLDKEASMVMAALDRSVEDAKTQIASMHLGVASCWNASVPKALAALSLSPSEFDSYLNETQVWTKFLANGLCNLDALLSISGILCTVAV